MATVEASTQAERPELLAASDAMIEDAVTYAEPMVLRGLLYQLTGDPELKEMPLAKVRVGRVEVLAPASDADVAMLRRKAADFLKSYRDAGAGPIGHGPDERLPVSLALAVGEEIPAYAIDLMVEEAAIDPWARSLKWQAEPDPERLANFSVTIIGAGMGGLNAAIQLERAGIRHQVIEKNPGVGGTWHDNSYPGARLDAPNSRAYTNLFGVDFPCRFQFGDYAQNKAYFEWVADHFGLRDRIAFNTEVRALTWDENAAEWEIRVDGPGGERTLRSNAVISGVGFLSRPNIPEIEGQELFEGRTWHTTRWPEGETLKGKRVAVIGTGCTGYQLIPEIALDAAHVTVFQRTAQWLFPVAGYLQPYPEQLLWLDRNLPLHTNFMRFKGFYGSGPDFVKMFDIDPDFKDPHALSPVNKMARDRSIEFLASKFDDPKMVEIMTPPHPPWSSRPVVVDPEYSIVDALQRDNVTLVTSGIRRFTRTGIEAKDGTQHDVDVIVYATGFRATDFLYPMKITGRGGRTIEELWADGGARAYLGCMMPGFPNLWTLYGPNTNGGLPVSQFHEVTTLYAMQCIERLILDDKGSVDVTEDAYWRYNRLVDEGNARKIWSDPRANTYWQTKHGRTASQIPFPGYEIRENLKHPDFADLIVR